MLLILSPLWFLAIYAVLVALLPITTWLHRRFDVLVLVWGAGLAALVDVGRFRYGWDALGWLNMVLVWGLCHQLGFFYDRLVRASRQVAWSMAFGGLFTLSALVFSGLYPGSMVGVPGDRLSNMAPPTVCIAALLVLQVGVALLVRPWVVERLNTRSGWQRANGVMTRVSLPALPVPLDRHGHLGHRRLPHGRLQPGVRDGARRSSSTPCGGCRDRSPSSGPSPSPCR